MDRIYESLAEIVGEEYVSNRKEELYIYSRDPGMMEPHEPDYVVMPKTTEEVQKIVKLANKEKIPIVPVGGSLSLSGLVIPHRGGIVLDLKMMDRVLEVNEKSRYVVVEGGITQGKLKAYLERYHPNLRHSIPDAPPSATVVGNIVIHGQGRLSQQYGFNSDMVTGLEVVLPTGEICKIGSCSVSPYWFSLAPLPDLAGLFLGWFGTTGIITKLGLKLYPKKKIRDIEVFVVEDPNLVPDVIHRVTHTEMIEDIFVGAQPYPLVFKDIIMIGICLTGDSEEELEFKRRIVWDALRIHIDSKEGGFMMLTPDIKRELLEMPTTGTTRFADVMKGGGFEYCGPIIPVEKFPEAYRKLLELSSKHGITYGHAGRVIGRSHCMMFSFGYPFNRADPDNIERTKKALHDSNVASLDVGGVPWKPEVPAQKMVMERMDKNTLELMKRIKKFLDPNGIMNPGNWEAE
ncbi:MAG: FAD-binding oxidoreductase [Candidatus Bathyarchaeaceae archaeon]